MSVWLIGIFTGIALIAVLIGRRSWYANVFSILFVLGFAGLAIDVTTIQIEQYWTERAASTRAFERQSANAIAVPELPRVQPPTGPPPPMTARPATGAAAPAAVRNPYSQPKTTGASKRPVAAQEDAARPVAHRLNLRRKQ